MIDALRIVFFVTGIQFNARNNQTRITNGSFPLIERSFTLALYYHLYFGIEIAVLSVVLSRKLSDQYQNISVQ